jgi:uncharacterized repeat protein (TIGR03803 family)
MEFASIRRRRVSYAALILLCGAAACGTRGTNPAILPEAPYSAQTESGAYKTLYSFNGTDGSAPFAGLIDVSGTFYGTTNGGGAHKWGTVFSITASGKERVLYSFAGSSDGEYPLAGLIDVSGTLYGTTHGGGKYAYGTVFSVTTKGKEKVLHSFGYGKDGTDPVAGLIDVNGTLYGTTSSYGASLGTLFSITTKGKEKVLYSFPGGSDGEGPWASLLELDGTLYGTTLCGGKYGGACSSGTGSGGTVFSATTKGKEKVLHSFGQGSDGAGPRANLVAVNGTLYGTTYYGGKGSCSGGCGTIFSVTTKGKEKVLYNFAGGSDGSNPAAGLFAVNGVLYGTTFNGGGTSCTSSSGSGKGCGTVFSVSTSGKERVIYRFKGKPDGQGPSAPLISENGLLYGTTVCGGKYGGVCNGTAIGGTVFSLSP